MYILKHSPLKDVVFIKNSDNFTVNEVPLYEFSQDGEHLVMQIRKKDLTTWDMLKVLSEHSGVKVRDFGYAGLKDKDGMTIQYISVLKKYEENFASFSHEKIKILNKTYHKNKIKIGHLRGNRFFIRLKKVSSIDAQKLKSGMEFLNKNGFPNFFGYQRFGKEQNNALEGYEILSGKKKMKNKKMKNFLISAYQSELFNKWLEKRIEISHLIGSFELNDLQKMLPFGTDELKSTKKQQQFLKIFSGDVMHHYPHGKAFLCEDLDDESKRFYEQDITLTGWLIGSRAAQSQDTASSIEEDIFKDALAFKEQMTGSRRFAWSFLEDVECRYNEEKAWFELNFTLQKGSYATTILEQLLKQES